MKESRSQIVRAGCFLAMLVVMSCFGMASAMTVQENVSGGPQKPEGKQKTGGRPTGPPHTTPHPITCESFAALVDNAVLEWQEVQDTYLIIIARLGEGENADGLSKSRLRGVESYLKRYNGKVAYITAEGSRIKGLGQIEIYVGGKLRATIPIKKNDESVCSGQVNPFF